MRGEAHADITVGGTVAFEDPLAFDKHMKRGISRVEQGHVLEQPWWNSAAMFFALNRPSGEVAELVGVSKSTIRSALKNRDFQEKIARLVQENGGTDCMALLRANVISATNVIVEIMNDDKNLPKVRLDSAKEILDRVYGKPTQHVVSDTTVRSDDPVAEAERLEAENHRLRGQGGLN